MAENRILKSNLSFWVKSKAIKQLRTEHSELLLMRWDLNVPAKDLFSCLTHKKDLFNCLTYKEVGCYAMYHYADKNWKFLTAYIITEASNILLV